MPENILLIALGEDSFADVRWGQVGEVKCAYSARLGMNWVGEELVTMARVSTVIVLVPTRYVAFRNTVFQGKLRLAKPLALAYPHENGFLSNIEQMHWIVLDSQKIDFRVAGIALEKMNYWIDWLNGYGVRADKMLPDALALPLPGQCSVACFRRKMLIRTGVWNGMQLPATWEDYELPVKPDLCFYSEVEVSEELEVNAFEEDPFWRLAEEAWNSKFNLMQGKFKPAVRWSYFIPRNILSVILLTILALLLCGFHNQQISEKTEHQIEGIYRNLLPGHTLTLDPVASIDGKIGLMKKIINNQKFFNLLPYAVDVLSSWEKPKIKTFIFDAEKNELVIKIMKNKQKPMLVPNLGSVSISITEEKNMHILRIGGEQ